MSDDKLLTDPVGATQWLFSYGTLQDPVVQQANFGRLLSGRDDVLLDYEQTLIEIRDPAVVATSGKSKHPIIQPSMAPGSEVAGMVFLLTPAELIAADAYEVDDYKRIAVTMKSGITAWAYVQGDR
jgi:hypothetical protein